MKIYQCSKKNKKERKNLNCSSKGAEREVGMGAGIRGILEREKQMLLSPTERTQTGTHLHVFPPFCPASAYLDTK